MAGYKKFSDTWRDRGEDTAERNVPKTLAGLATLAGDQAGFQAAAAAEKSTEGAAKVAKVAALAPSECTGPPAKVAKAAKVLQCSASSDAEPSGTGCQVEIVELPQAQRFRKVFGFLQLKPPAHVPEARWRQCVSDGSRFLAKWGEQAEALGWSSADLFALDDPPEKPHPTYSRLSRYDCTGLCWLLQGRPVVALTEATAAIENKTGNITTYRKSNKPALGPVGDSLEDLK